MIDTDVKFGKKVRIYNKNLVNIFGCKIGDETFVGPFVEITRGVEIGKRCKIESHAFICDGVTIEEEVFIGHGVVFTNDLYPKIRGAARLLKTQVGYGASIGSNSTIIGGISIGKMAIIGAGSVVTKNVSDFSIVAGNPAKILKKFKNEGDMVAYISLKK